MIRPNGCKHAPAFKATSTEQHPGWEGGINKRERGHEQRTAGHVSALELQEDKAGGLVAGCHAGDENGQDQGAQKVPGSRQGADPCQQLRADGVDKAMDGQYHCMHVNFILPCFACRACAVLLIKEVLM